MTTATPTRKRRPVKMDVEPVPAPAPEPEKPVVPRRKVTPKAKPATTTAVEVTEPEINLAEYADKPPSKLNIAEAEWLNECTGLGLDERELELAAKIVKLVAGPCHRHWQASKANKALHGK